MIRRRKPLDNRPPPSFDPVLVAAVLRGLDDPEHRLEFWRTIEIEFLYRFRMSNRRAPRGAGRTAFAELAKAILAAHEAAEVER